MKAGFRQSMAWLHTWGGLSFGWILFAIFLAGTLSVFASEINIWMEAPPSAFWNSIFPPGDGGSFRSTWGGRHFIRLHYALHADIFGIWIVGFATIGMLAAIVSGVITHARIFRDFFVFRPGKGQRAWLDAHNVFGVMTLPFMLMIAYTGLVIFYTIYMPFAIQARYGDEERAFRRELQGRPPIAGPAQAGTTQTVEKPPPKHPPLYVLPDRFRQSGPLAAQGTMFALHILTFGDAMMRWLYFVCGLASTVAIGAGLQLFVVKRQDSGARTLQQFAARMNVGVIAGMCVSCIGYFWINRLAPSDVMHRSDLEISGFALIWVACVAHAFARGPTKAWGEQWLAAGALCAGLPILNMATSDMSLLTTLPKGDWGVASVDLFALGAACVFSALARAAYRKQNAAAAEAPTREQIETNAA